MISDVNNLGMQQSKTKVLLKRLPLAATESSIRDAVAELNCRRVEIEPGCAVHFTSEVAAERSRSLIANFGCHSMLKPAVIPALLLNNMSPSVSTEVITTAFKKYDPKMVRLLSSAGLEIVLASPEEALAVQKAINQVEVGGQKLRTHSLMLPDNKPALQIFNIPASSSAGDVQQLLVKTISEVSASAAPQFSVTKPVLQSVKLRFGGNSVAHAEEAIKKLASVEIKGKTGSIVASSQTPIPYKKPAVFLRNVHCMTSEQVQETLGGHNYERVQMMHKSKDVTANLAIVYFSSEEEAAKCFYSFKSKPKRNDHGEKIEASLKFTAEPAVLMSNVPAAVDEAQVGALFERFSVERIEKVAGGGEGEASSFVVVFSAPRLAQLAVEGMNKKVVEGGIVSVQLHRSQDAGVEIQFPDGLPDASSEEILAALKSQYSIDGVKSISVDSNTSAVVGFESMQQLLKAQKHFNDKVAPNSLSSSDSPDCIPSIALLRSKMTTHPSYVMEVTNLPVETPASELRDVLLQEITCDNEIAESPSIRVDRNAIVKFKRNQEVVPGMKKLKEVSFGEGVPVQVLRYQPLIADGTSAYDHPDDMDQFDAIMGKDINQDYLASSPATRYQLLKNTFERSLYDAVIKQNVGYVVDVTNTPAALKTEVQSALVSLQTMKDKPDSQEKKSLEERLFEIYTQRRDLDRFTKGFDELSVLFGEPNEAHPLHWSQYTENSLPADFVRIQEKLRALDQEALDHPEVALGLKQPSKDSLFHKSKAESLFHNPDGSAMVLAADADHSEEELEVIRRKKRELKVKQEAEDQEAHMARFGFKNKASDDDLVDKRDPIDKNITVSDEEGVDHVINLEDPLLLRDKTGFSWSGIVLDNDTTQKTMPGGRVMTHRCLVVVGNLRGTAGFGKGKGKNADDALNSAFR